ncbi:MAG: hypothetical protein L0H84_19320 [Pseudonocardia sp.]|nr:hypothetical protein [Pseudonocardia sp.]
MSSQPPADVSAERSPSVTARSAGLFALGLGVVALVSAWTGWGAVAVGFAAIVCAAVSLWIARHCGVRRGQALLGALLGTAALVIGLVVEWDALFAADEEHFGVGLTLDQCMAGADTAKLQHLCKTQHLDEFMRRYPSSDE